MKLKIAKKVNAYNLQELLVVLVIIGILILIALPTLMPQIAKAKSIEAKVQLNHLYGLQKNHFSFLWNVSESRLSVSHILHH